FQRADPVVGLQRAQVSRPDPEGRAFAASVLRGERMSGRIVAQQQVCRGSWRGAYGTHLARERNLRTDRPAHFRKPELTALIGPVGNYRSLRGLECSGGGMGRSPRQRNSRGKR